jgi:2',3'-cyclic-nucleotide 2'-phosphodiesterase (5'-nucleotidase family)
MVDRLRAEEPSTLIVDSGDLFFDANSANSQDALKKAQLIIRVYKHMATTAVNVGDLDLLQGLDFLKKTAAEDLPLVSANLLAPQGRAPIVSPYVLQEVAGVRFAFLGLLSPQLRPQVQRAVHGAVLIDDPAAAVRRTLEAIDGKADVVVLLSDLGLEKDRQVARDIPGIDFILGGHDGRFLRWAEHEGDTYILQSYKKGMYLGKLDLTITKPDAAFQDQRAEERLRQEITNLERRIQALERARNSRSSPSLDRSIQRMTREKTEMLDELKRSSDASPTGNRFNWALEPLGMNLPEDPEVKGWIRASGITQD